MKVSVYMTVKNGYPFVKDAIDSIRVQTYKNWELIVVDDGSTDKTHEYLKSIEGDDERFKFVYTDGIGRAKALNLAVSHTKGELIANLDADDLAHPERLERQLKIFEWKENEEISFLCTNSIVFFDQDIPVWGQESIAVNAEDVTDKLLINNPVNHSSVMMSRSLFMENGGYDDNLKRVIDYDFWCRLVINGEKVYRIDDSLAAKRIHRSQSFENKKRFIYLIDGFKIKVNLIKKTKASVVYYIISVAKLIYGFFPQKLRAKFLMK